MRTWPQEGPKVLWAAPVGLGFGGAAVSDGHVYLLDWDEKVGTTSRLRPGQRQGPLELCVRRAWCVHVRRIKDHPHSRWQTRLHQRTAGRPARIDTKTHKPVWHKNIWKDFGGGELPRWAIVQHPLSTATC